MKINYTNILFGVIMILANLGIRYIHLDITKNQDKILSLPIMRLVYVFSMVFLLTGDIIASSIVSLSYYLIMQQLI